MNDVDTVEQAGPRGKEALRAVREEMRMHRAELQGVALRLEVQQEIRNFEAGCKRSMNKLVERYEQKKRQAREAKGAGTKQTRSVAWLSWPWQYCS